MFTFVCMEELNNQRYLSSSLLELLFLKYRLIKQLKVLGNSGMGLPIYGLKIGKGKTKVLIWSQMHGNESTTTKSLFDFYEFLSKKKNSYNILNSITYLIIFQLNPDGANLYSRNNANDVDLNRDALLLKEPESNVLNDTFVSFKPNYCFNLHGQRTIYRVSGSNNPASISFLSPSVSNNNIITDSRKTSMQLIFEAYKVLIKKYKNIVSRYDDSFNINCFGDSFTKRGVPTVLIEAGHYPDDFYRTFSRKMVFNSLVIISNSISSNSFKKTDYIEYFKIPENKDDLRDVIIKNFSVKLNGKIIKNQEISIQYREELDDKKINFIPVIDEISNKLHYKSCKEYTLNDIESSNNVYEIAIGDNAEKLLKALNL